MNKEEKKEILKAALSGDRETFDKLTKGRVIYFNVDGQYYRGNLETPISPEQFNSEYRPGSDTLIETGTQNAGIADTMRKFGLSENEINSRLAENDPENTVNEVIKLKERLSK